jgi:lipopolysaccharide assembly outer membrane protein LptD (OstA)
MLRKTLIALVLIAAAFGAAAQEAASGEEAGSSSASGAGSQIVGSSGSQDLAAMSELERSSLALDIAVSNYYELKTLAASKGLSTEGSAADIRARLYAYFGVQAPEAPAVDSSLTIESASSFEYFTMEEGGDKVISFQGPVSIKMRTTDGFTHTIKADEVLFDRDKNIVDAKGSVIYTRVGPSRSDEFRGETIVVDLGSYSGVFLNGSYDLAPSGSFQRSLFFNFQKFSRRSQDLTILEDAKITACDDPVPHYHIRAKKVWLFGNGDWALSGATLYVGVVPLVWLPFFYYPSDDILFHPVIGYRSREGAYVQTTTYLLGERPASTATNSSSSLSLFESSGGTTELKGIFLKRVQSAAGDKGNAQAAASKDRFAIMTDIYSALGVYAGVEGHFEGKVLGGLDFSLSAAESRSLFLESNGYYSPFDYSNSYASTWNSSSVFGLELPLRFGLDLSYKNSGGSGGTRYSIAFLCPIYSDPYYLQDFSRRSESSSIFSAFTGNTTTVNKTSTLTQSLISSLSWNAGKDAQSALLANVTLSKLGAQMTWKTRSQSTTGLTTAQKRLLAVDPQRDFFYPDDLEFLDAAFSSSGTLLRASSDDATKAQDPGAQPKVALISSSLSWTASGTASAEEKFLSSGWAKPADIDGSPYYLLFGMKGAFGLASDTQVLGNLLDLKMNLSVGAQDQLRPYLYDERSSPTTVHPYKLSDYAYRTAYSDLSSGLTLQPFSPTSPFSSSSLSYNIGGRLYSYDYTGLSGSGVDATPLYASTWIGWDSTTLTTHTATASLGYISPSKLVQRLSLQANLPPQLEKYSASYSLSQKFLNASLQGAVSKLSSSADLLPSSLTASLSLGGSPYPTLRSDLSWDFDAMAPSSSVTSLEYLWSKLAFTAKKAKGYSFASGLWSVDGTNYFRPYEASLTLGPTVSLAQGRLRIDGTTGQQAVNPAAATGEATQAALGNSLGLILKPKLSYTQNFLKFTDSTLGAGLDLTLASKDGTSLSFSAASANKAAWRYWPAFFPATASFDPADYYKNIFTDIWESFSIWDSSALKRSLFKLQSLSLSLTQDLHDWNLSAALSMSPLLYTPDSGRPYYQLDFSFSIGVTWKDISELKTSLSYTEGAFEN